MDSNNPQTEHHIDVISKERAMLFYLWMGYEKYVTHGNGFFHKEPPEAGKQVFFTLGELYDKFNS